MKQWLPHSAYWKDVSWIASGTAVAQAIGLVTMPLLTRMYEPADFAALSIFTQAVALTTVLVTFRFEYAVPLPHRDVDAVGLLRLVAILAAVGTLVWTVVVIALAPQIGHWREQEPTYLWTLVPGTAALMGLATATQHLAQRRLQYRLAGIAEVVGKLGYFTMALGGFLVLPSPIGLLLAVGIGALAKAVCFAVQPISAPKRPSANRRRVWLRIFVRNAIRYRGLSRSMVASHLMLTLTGLLPALFVSQAYGADALGQMSLVIATTYLPSALIGAAIGQVYFQRAAQLWREGRDFADLWRMTARKLTLVGLPLYLGLAFVSTWIYPFVFGPRWQQAGEFATIMSLSAFLSFLTAPLDRSCIVVGAWRYIPAWHLGRLLSTMAVMAAAWHFHWSVMSFVTALTLQMSALYLVDMVAERRFSSLKRGDAGR